jgi:hypothetical protein
MWKRSILSALLAGLVLAAGCSSASKSPGTCTQNPDCVGQVTLTGDCEQPICFLGECHIGPAADGTPCDDGDQKTTGEACLAGICSGGSHQVPCPDPPACDLAPPDPGPAGEWRHIDSSLISQATPYHRGRDLFLAEDGEQWALAKFTYGLIIDKDIHDEDVDLWLLRGCTAWEFLGTARTSDDGQNPTVLGIEDTGGRVFFRIPDDRRLAEGRHRIHFVVRGDLSTAEQFIQVLPPGARVAVTDIDGTLTTSENAQAWDVLLSISPEAHPGAADALWALARKGYRLFYLTARPEFLGGRTQAWLAERGFPPGISHTTLSLTGASGSEATAYKLAELNALEKILGYPPSFAFGNKDTDVAAYVQAGIDPAQSYYFELSGDAQGGVIHNDYTALVPTFEALNSLCVEQP